MTLQIFFLLAVIGFMILAFALEWLPVDLVALISLALLLIFGLITAEQAVAGFSNPAVVTIIMMFIMSQALVESGAISKLGHRIATMTGHSQHTASVALLLVVGVLSAFINNTVAVAVFLPVAMHLANHFRISPSRILMPLSFAAIMGGTATLVGTSTNLLVKAVAEEQGVARITVFEFMLLGGVLFVVGSIYNILIPLRLLPSRATSSLTRKYHLTDYLTELRVPPGSNLIGRTVLQEQISERFQLTVLEILRGDQQIAENLRNTPVAADDILIVEGAVEDIVSFREQNGLLLLTDVKLGDDELSDRNTILVEAQLSPTSSLVGSTLKEIDFRRTFGCFVLALGRTGESIRKKLGKIQLKQWDTLLVFGPRARIEALYQKPDFVPMGELNIPITLSPTWWLDVAIIPAVVMAAALGWATILEAALVGAVAVLAMRRLTMRQAYKAIDWSVIFLLAATVPLGAAMHNTGLSDMIGASLSTIGHELGPQMLVGAIFGATALLTSFFSNNATAILMVTIAVSTANQLGIDPKPLVMAVAYAASTCFMTPIGYQTNAMVLTPGNYRFLDFVKFGLPLVVMFLVISTLLIPVIWPF